MEYLLLYLPFLLIAALDFLVFRGGSENEKEPEVWRCRQTKKYDVGLAARREDSGYGAG